MTRQPESADHITADGQIAKIMHRSKKSHRRQLGFLGAGFIAGAVFGLGASGLAADKDPDTARAVITSTALAAEGTIASFAIGERARARRRYREVVFEFLTSHREELESVEEIPKDKTDIKVRIPFRNRIFPAAPSALTFQGSTMLTLATDERVPATVVPAGLVALGVSVAARAADRWFEKDPRDAYIGKIKYSEEARRQLTQKDKPPSPEE